MFDTPPAWWLRHFQLLSSRHHGGYIRSSGDIALFSVQIPGVLTFDTPQHGRYLTFSPFLRTNMVVILI